MECWGDDLPGGQTTDFMGAAQAKGGENVVFSWIVWPSREARDAGYKLVMADPRMKMEESTSFDGGRLIFGGFEVMLDTDQAAPAS